MYKFVKSVLRRQQAQGRHRLVLEPSQSDQVLRQAHDTLGHKGYYPTLRTLLDRFWWPSLTTDVKPPYALPFSSSERNMPRSHAEPVNRTTPIQPSTKPSTPSSSPLNRLSGSISPSPSPSPALAKMTSNRMRPPRGLLSYESETPSREALSEYPTLSQTEELRVPASRAVRTPRLPREDRLHPGTYPRYNRASSLQDPTSLSQSVSGPRPLNRSESIQENEGVKHRAERDADRLPSMRSKRILWRQRANRAVPQGKEHQYGSPELRQ